MGWRKIFRGRRLQLSMRSCTRPREPCEAPLAARDKQDKADKDCRHSRRVQERPLRARENPRKIWSKRLEARRKPLEARDKPGARWSKRRKLRRRLRNRQGRSLETRSRLRRGRGRAHETKSLLEHLIKSNKERKTAAGRRRPGR